MNIVIIGTGYVGLVTGVGLANLGNNVTFIDLDEDKINKLKNKNLTFYEPGLDQYFQDNQTFERMQFVSNYSDQTKFELNLEKVSNDKYLKINDIESPIINNKSKLFSYLNFQNSGDSYFLSTSVGAYEDLGKAKDNRFEFIYPEFSFYKELEQKNDTSNGNFIFTSDGYNKNYNTNITESVLINDLLYGSNLDYFGNGFTKNYKILLRNVNTNAKNSVDYKNSSNFNLLSTFIFETSYPLLREGVGFNNYLTPKVSFRYSPNNMKNLSDSSSRINMTNIFEIDIPKFFSIS